MMKEHYPILELPGAKEKIEHYWKTYSPTTDLLCFDDDYANKQMMEVFSKFKCGYFRAPRDIAEVIFGTFNYYEIIKVSRLGNEMNLYYVTNKGEIMDEYKNI